MEMRRVGTSGLWVSRLALGTMTWGRDTDADDAGAQLKAFVNVGGALVDTADVYTDGLSESVLGGLLATVVERDELTIATKAGIDPAGTRRRNTSRGHLLSALDASLQRLGTDYIDLWQLHAWDEHTPLEETLSALEIAVRSGRVRYVGVSNFAAWQLATAASRSNFALVSSQVEYSLLARAVEKDLTPAAEFHGMGVLAWSPLGRGVLTGKYRSSTPPDSRAASPHFQSFVGRYLDDSHTRVVDAVATAADGLGVSPLAVALAWVRDRPGVVAPIVGARTSGQLMASLQSEDLTLPSEIRAALDDVSAVLLAH
ncbi:MAG: aldo/keto reductase [Corynebacteriales bacterium]|nr:aldo/keto reductase [Mycobacteriales bacterium]